MGLYVGNQPVGGGIKIKSFSCLQLTLLLEWPMQLYESNHDRFFQLGVKDRLTVFILPAALYAENHNGDKIEMVLLTDDLNFWEGMLIRKNKNSFEMKLLRSEDFRREVQRELMDL